MAGRRRSGSGATLEAVTAAGDQAAAPATKPRTRRQPTKTAREQRAERTTEAYSRPIPRMERIERGLTAASEVLDPKDPVGKSGTPAPNAVTRTWQHAAWGYVHSVPELNAAKMFVGNCLARCELRVGKRNKDGTVDQAFNGEEPADGVDGGKAAAAADIIASIRGPRGGQSEVLRSHGEKTFVIGEEYLLPLDTPAGKAFEILSTQELMKNGQKGGGWTRYYGPGWDPEELPADVKPIRIWRPDAQYGKIADSSVRSCLELLEELVVLTRLVRASAISRMALAGILAIPDELDTPDDGEGPDGEQSESKNPLAVDIINTGAKAIDDPASAAAFMPFILQGPAEYIEKIKHIPFQAADHEQVIQRTEGLQRLAQGLDLPVEVVLGHQQTTFANAAQISEDTFKLHIEPTLTLLCDALTVAVLWPEMAAEQGLDPEHLKNAPYPDDILAFAVTYDASKLISRPDRAKEIADAFVHDLSFTGVRISEFREALGLDPDTPPADDEVAFRVNAYRLGRIREVIQGTTAEAAVPVEDATVGGAPIPARSGGKGAASTKGQEEEVAAATAAATATLAAPVPPAAAAEQTATRQAALDASGAPDREVWLLSEKVAACGDLTIDRVVERVGSKLRPKLRSTAVDDATRETLRNVPQAQVTRVLGKATVEQLLPRDGVETTILTEVNALTRKVKRWAAQAGVVDPDDAAGSIAALVSDAARSALYDPRPLTLTPDMLLVRLGG